jgi:homospermidine synthase
VYWAGHFATFIAASCHKTSTNHHCDQDSRWSAALTRENFQSFLNDNLSAGDFLLNLSVDVSSIDLIKFCQERGALYLDTCIEPWEGGYTDSTIPMALRTNYALRIAALDLRKDYPKRPTAVLTHGANPGLVSHLVKQALINMAEDNKLHFTEPKTQTQWGELAHTLGIKVIHIAERDTQISKQPKRLGEFVNTWSVDGFISEGSQPAELGWGTHEHALPLDGAQHDFGNQCSIYLKRPGASTRVRTWTPLAGPFHGFLITHSESISIADYFTLKKGNSVYYRPTVHYAYHPCGDAVLSIDELAGREWDPQENKRLLYDDILEGRDELGVLLMGNQKGAYWYGSQLTIEEARQLVPYNNATSLQVAISVLAGLVWAIKNPKRGIVEPDEIDYRFILNLMGPYLGDVVGCYTDWTPLQEREKLFPEEMDHSDPWQFINVRVQ